MNVFPVLRAALTAPTPSAATLGLLFLAPALLHAPALVAQDKIYWTDGTVEDKTRVSSFTVNQVEFRGKNGPDAKPANLVEDIELAKVKDEYARAIGASLDERAGTFLDIAKRLKDSDPFLAQFGYWEAAKFLREQGEPEQAILALDQLRKDLPNSGFVREYYRYKLEYYMGRDKLSDASTVADQYSLDAQTKGFPKGYVVESSYYKTLIDARKDQSSPATLRDGMQRILQSAAGMPALRARIQLQIANTYRYEDALDQAEEGYREIAESDSVPADALAGAHVGIGHVLLKRGDNRAAMLSFLRAYMLYEDAPGYAPEALHYGAVAAKGWDGPDARLIQRRLLGRLKRDYPESEFAKLN
jgi:tetratricopeptide (TPR) repeat protein